MDRPHQPAAGVTQGRGDRVQPLGELLVRPHVAVLVDPGQALAQLVGVGDGGVREGVEGPLQESAQPLLRPGGEHDLARRGGVHRDPGSGPVPDLDVVVGGGLVDVMGPVPVGDGEAGILSRQLGEHAQVGPHDRHQIGSGAGHAGQRHDLRPDAVVTVVIDPFHGPDLLQGPGETGDGALGQAGAVGQLGDPQVARGQSLENAEGSGHRLYARHRTRLPSLKSPRLLRGIVPRCGTENGCPSPQAPPPPAAHLPPPSPSRGPAAGGGSRG